MTRVASAQTTAARVDATRLQTTLMDLRRFGGTPAGGTHRLGYSTEDKQARVVVAGWMQEAGLVPATDLAGNLIGRRAGSVAGPAADRVRLAHRLGARRRQLRRQRRHVGGDRGRTHARRIAA